MVRPRTAVTLAMAASAVEPRCIKRAALMMPERPMLWRQWMAMVLPEWSCSASSTSSGVAGDWGMSRSGIGFGGGSFVGEAQLGFFFWLQEGHHCGDTGVARRPGWLVGIQ